MPQQPQDDTQQKLLQLSYLQSLGQGGGPQPTVPQAPGEHTPTVKHPAYSRGQ